MQSQWLAHVATVLYDPVHANRHLTRNALFTLGFRQIEAVTTLHDLRRTFESGSFDLVIVDVTNEEAEICRQIRELRLGRIGSSAFPVVIATSWKQSGDLVRNVIECGADDLLIRPLSTGGLKSRIEQQIENRKQFVVTSSYIGPDRRRSTSRDHGQSLIDVPNSLRMKAKDGILNGPPANEVEEVKRQIERQRLERDAFHIGLACQFIEQHLQSPDDSSYNIKKELADLAETALDLKLRLKAPELAPVAALCEGVESAVKELGEALKGKHAAQSAAKPLALLSRLSQAVQLTLDAGKDEGALSREIAETVERIKARRAAIAEDRAASASPQVVNA